MLMTDNGPASALRLTIDREALASNWQALDRLSASARTGAAVKANGYGIGARQVVPVLSDAGCRDFFVAYSSEAGEILDLVPPVQISVLHGPLTDAESAWMKATGLKPVINSLQQAQRWVGTGGGLCDLMVDTGINRLGIPMEGLGDPAIACLEIDTILSHLASADEDCELNQRQLARWNEARAVVAHRRASLANSAGIALGGEFLGDLTRPGLALYGGIPRSELDGTIRQVARPQAMVMQVRQIKAGETIGYNATFTAPEAMRVGTIALGYADGYLRCWSDCGMLHGGGAALRVLGRVSMDMTVIDLSAAPEVKEGDWVEADYALPDAAMRSGLSQYELLTLLGRRFQR